MEMDIYGKNRLFYLHYNGKAWSILLDYLGQWGIDVSKFANSRGGKSISAEICRKVADALAAHYAELIPEDKEWLEGHSDGWQQMAKEGGGRQW